MYEADPSYEFKWWCSEHHLLKIKCPQEWLAYITQFQEGNELDYVYLKEVDKLVFNRQDDLYLSWQFLFDSRYKPSTCTLTFQEVLDLATENKFHLKTICPSVC